jgi:hypothetical protein
MSFFEPPPPTKYTVLNLGAGVQSSALALMAAKGEVGPMPDFAVFADTQAEPTSVYKWLDWLEQGVTLPKTPCASGRRTARFTARSPTSRESSLPSGFPTRVSFRECLVVPVPQTTR